MSLENFQQIEQLFNSQIPEGQTIDYKREVYKIDRTQFTPTEANHTTEQRVEFLKDVCSLLNSGGGSLILGIAELRDGTPSGTIRRAGISRSSLPNNYTETLEQIIITGISPIPTVRIMQIANSKNRSRVFIVINIPSQSHPIFAVQKDRDGYEFNALFTRRGRNIGKMNTNEIRERISSFSSNESHYNNNITRINDKTINKQPERDSLLLISTPVSDSFKYKVLNNEGIENILRRSEETWEGHSFHIGLNELNLFPQPTMDGIKIEQPNHLIEIWEDGTIFCYIVLIPEHELKEGHFNDSEKPELSKQWYALNPHAIEGYIKNFSRFCDQYYHYTNFGGEVIIRSSLYLRSIIYAYRNKDNYDLQPQFNPQTNYLMDIDSFNSHYGPKEMTDKALLVIQRFDTFDFPFEKLQGLDDLTKQELLDYLWRGFGFEQFPG